jgi:hypothetical protein
MLGEDEESQVGVVQQLRFCQAQAGKRCVNGLHTPNRVGRMVAAYVSLAATNSWASAHLWYTRKGER